MNRQEAVMLLGRLAREAGGCAYYVGGYVRDNIMGVPCKDIDIEVHGVTPETLKDILSQIGKFKSVGTAFGIYLLGDYDIDVALPRRESCTGSGHRDFEIYVDPFLGIENAAKRRDFTINSMMMDVLTGEIHDPFGGRDDIKAGIIRHVDDSSFAEDPLRVLRGCQFAARFGYAVAAETMELCSKMNLSALAGERVEAEMKKALLKAEQPSVFFNTLRDMGQLDRWFPELKSTIGIPQDKTFHPEGDVWNHTMECLDRAAKLRHRAKEPYRFMLLALTHDFGKITTTAEKNGKIHAYRHELEGVAIMETFIQRLTTNKDVLKYLTNMLPLHMRPNIIAAAGSSIKSSNRLFDEAKEPFDLILFALADIAPIDDPAVREVQLTERLEIYRQTMAKPYVTAGDLIAAGLTPGESFGKLLEFSHKLRLAGVEKDTALKQTLAMSRKQR